MRKGLGTKAQANILSISILIVIVLVVGLIIFSFSNNFIQKEKSKTEGHSFYYNAELKLLSELSSGPVPGNHIQLGVRRIDNEGEVNGVRFIFTDNNGASYSYDDYDNLPNSVGFFVNYDINLDTIGVQSEDINKIGLILLYGDQTPTPILDEIFVGA